MDVFIPPGSFNTGLNESRSKMHSDLRGISVIQGFQYCDQKEKKKVLRDDGI